MYKQAESWELSENSERLYVRWRERKIQKGYSNSAWLIWKHVFLSSSLHGRRSFTNELEKADTLSCIIWKYTSHEMFIFKDKCEVFNLKT